MISTEIAIYNDTEFIKTWSDLDVMIERDGAMYESAVDPIDSGRTYTETDQPIVDESEAMEEDYLAALERFGVRHDQN